MQLPFFYIDHAAFLYDVIVLDENNSKHIVQVLRMKEGEQLRLTDGLGRIYTADIVDAHKKKCSVKVIALTIAQPKNKNISIAISPVKNNSRFEWFLEKATEAGVSAIIPIICTRSEKDHFRLDRMRGILISAMLQSQQAFLPVLAAPIKFHDFIAVSANSFQKKYIAHCEESERISLRKLLAQQQREGTGGLNNEIILIGPEGDFTKEEILSATQSSYSPVVLGDTRLRTETAGLVAAILLCID